MSTMAMETRSIITYTCQVSPEYFNKINNLTGAFPVTWVRSGTRKMKASMTKCFYLKFLLGGPQTYCSSFS